MFVSVVEDLCGIEILSQFVSNAFIDVYFYFFLLGLIVSYNARWLPADIRTVVMGYLHSGLRCISVLK